MLLSNKVTVIRTHVVQHDINKMICKANEYLNDTFNNPVTTYPQIFIKEPVKKEKKEPVKKIKLTS